MFENTSEEGGARHDQAHPQAHQYRRGDEQPASVSAVLSGIELEQLAHDPEGRVCAVNVRHRRAFFRTIAERDPPRKRVREFWIIAGRRAGKDSIATSSPLTVPRCLVIVTAYAAVSVPWSLVSPAIETRPRSSTATRPATSTTSLAAFTGHAPDRERLPAQQRRRHLDRHQQLPQHPRQAHPVRDLRRGQLLA